MYIISGDHEQPTKKLAQALGIEHYFANTLPENKADLVEQLRKDGRSICFVGDGVNDTIALKKAEERPDAPIEKRVRFETLVRKEDQFNRELLINVLTTTTAVVHLSYGGQLFILNGLGFAALLAARHALPKRESYQKYPRDGLFGYTALTVGGYFLKYGFDGFERIAALSIKLVEMGLMYTLWDERQAAKQGSLVFVVDEPDLDVIQAEYNRLSEGLAGA